MGRLISGTPYSLKEIFFGENDKIIIPDLQRDYCWGNPISKDSNESLVDSFLDSLFKLDKSKDITMGLIYGYYDTLMPYHLQLCDGQQRLTTLFLILGIINRQTNNNRYQDFLISNFELNEDDKEPHLLYGIRESSLYFLSDLTIHYFLDSNLSSDNLDKQPWFLNSYSQDPTISSISDAIRTIEAKLETYSGSIDSLGEFLTERVKFLFYDMNNRHNGEETFVVINTTGEPLSANQNLKPLIIRENSNYQRIELSMDGSQKSHSAADDWEEMETWFWQKRRMNDIDTSKEGMIAFLHCVHILESPTEEEWHKLYEIHEDKFPDSIKMERIWEWFCLYKRIYELSYKELYTTDLRYPENSSYYTQKELYALLPTMEYCNKFLEVSDKDIQRIYHLFSNMAKYRPVNRSSQNEAINVPAYRACQIVTDMRDKDVLSLMDIASFTIDEERTKLSFILPFKEEQIKREQIEKLFAKAENMSIFDGQISTLVNWSHNSLDELNALFDKILLYWGDENKHDKVRRALLAYDVSDHYPLRTGRTNNSLCNKSEWRTLFNEAGEKIREFIIAGNLDDIINNYADTSSSYYPLIKDPEHLKFSKNKQIRIRAKDVIELMEKTYESADFRLFHKGHVFEKDLVDKENWNGFWVWTDGNDSVFYTISKRYNLTLDMRILDNGYEIVAITDRNPQNTSIRQEVLTRIGFASQNGEWVYPIKDIENAKNEFLDITNQIIEKQGIN